MGTTRELTSWAQLFLCNDRRSTLSLRNLPISQYDTVISVISVVLTREESMRSKKWKRRKETETSERSSDFKIGVLSSTIFLKDHFLKNASTFEKLRDIRFSRIKKIPVINHVRSGKCCWQTRHIPYQLGGLQVVLHGIGNCKCLSTERAFHTDMIQSASDC